MRVYVSLLLAAAVAGSSACSLKTMAVKTVANTLSDSGDVLRATTTRS